MPFYEFWFQGRNYARIFRISLSLCYVAFQDQDTDNRLKRVGISVIDSGINPNKFIRTLEAFVANALDRVAAAGIEFGKKYNGPCIDNEFIKFENIEI